MANGDLVGAPSGRNHYISHNPKSTRCGQFKAEGWAPAHEGGEMCLKCAKGNYVGTRPLPNTFAGNKRGQARV